MNEDKIDALRAEIVALGIMMVELQSQIGALTELVFHIEHQTGEPLKETQLRWATAKTKQEELALQMLKEIREQGWESAAKDIAERAQQNSIDVQSGGSAQ